MPPRVRRPRQPRRVGYAPPTVEECTRCNARTSRGTRCTRSTCKYADKCWQHTIRDVGISIKTNPRHPQRGLGLWAERNLPRGLEVRYGRNPEDVVEPDELEGRNQIQNRYVLCNDAETLCFDARSTQAGLGRWVNDVRAGRMNSRLNVNDRTGESSLKLTRPVRRGQEIRTYYGPLYERDYRL